MNENKKKLGTFLFVIGGMSFIPLIGVLFGLFSIVFGLITKKKGGKKLALIGGGGIVFSILLYTALFYFGFVQRGGVYDKLRAELAESTLTSLVQAIEFYKAQYGEYPESLETLRDSLPKNSMVFIFDPSDVKIKGQPRYFYYELIGNDHYYLLSVGPDGQPFTEDDILPNIEIGAQSKVGLLIKDQSE